MKKTMFAMVAAGLLATGCVQEEGPEIATSKELVVVAPADIQSAHPYQNYTDQSWELTPPADAHSVIVTFDRFETESGYDWVDLYDADGERIHHLSGNHSGESFTVEGNYARIHFTSDYSITGWGVAASEFRYEIDDPGHATDHRPYCGAIGSDNEGWYWGDTDQLIELANCAELGEPACGAIGSRSEGWYSDDGLITWDFCHRTVRIALYDETCGGSIGFACYDGLYCHGWPIEGVIGGTGTCKWTGYCEESADCTADGNQWQHPDCTGHAECASENNQCQWQCDDPAPEGAWSWTSHLVADVASAHPYANDTDLAFDVTGSPDATQIKIMFSRIDTEAGYDQIVLSGDVEENAVVVDGHHQSYESPVFNGNTIHVAFHSDYSVTDWGFAVGTVTYYEQLAPGLCNRDEDCADGQYCNPHNCFNPFEACYGDCRAVVAGGPGEPCNDSDLGCEEGLFCKAITASGEGSCQDELWCAQDSVAADCANVIHPAVPGVWACVSDQCAWQPGMTSGSFFNDEQIAIPDNDSVGITSEIEVDGLLDCDRQVAVDVNIDHTYRGDLVVVLSDPQGVVSVLSNRDGGSADNLRLDAVPVDGALGADGIDGIWTLQVSDQAALDVGTLTSWGLHMSCN